MSKPKSYNTARGKNPQIVRHEQLASQRFKNDVLARRHARCCVCRRSTRPCLVSRHAVFWHGAPDRLVHNDSCARRFDASASEFDWSCAGGRRRPVAAHNNGTAVAKDGGRAQHQHARKRRSHPCRKVEAHDGPPVDGTVQRK